MEKKNIVIAVVIAISLVTGSLLLNPEVNVSVTSPDVNVNLPEQSLGSAGNEYNSRVIFNDGATINRVIPLIRSTTTDTGTSATLVARDFTNVQTHLVTLGGADEADFTYTLPATSTLGNFVPEVGSTATTCFFNIASSTSGSDLIFAAGTGWELKIATTTVPVPLGVGDGGQVCIESIRLPDGSLTKAGNISGILNIFADAD